MAAKFDAFYSTICQVCKNPPISEAKFCSGCKLVQYCCGEHQKEDWINHKDFCKSIKAILKKTKTDHIYQEVFGLSKTAVDSWNKTRASLVKLVEAILKRSLSLVETQILLFPPLCNLCHCYEQNKMYSCIGCNTVMYCSQEHQHKDFDHKVVCRHLFLAHKIDMQRYFKQVTAFNFRMISDLKVSKKFPDSMEKIFHLYNQNLSSEELLLSEPLSYSATLAFGLIQVKIGAFNSLTVHIVGADSMELLALETLPFFFRLFPKLLDLKLVMIGPNLPKTFCVPPKVKECCNFMIRSELYHEYTSSSDYISPDIIAAFDCGFCEYVGEPSKDSWKDSLPIISSVCNSVVVLTSYTSEESSADLQRLCDSGKSGNFTIVMNSKLNPFGSLYPHRDWENQDDGVFYVNKYISVLKT